MTVAAVQATLGHSSQKGAVPVVETMRLGPQRNRTMAEIDDDPRVAPSEDEQGSNVAPTTATRLKNTRGQPWRLTIRQQFSRLS
jgi:hypothetical protein